MKYFLCTLNNNCSLGIPAEQIEQIVPVKREQSVLYEKENDEVFISIPALFRLESKAAPHGLVLKVADPIKTVLLCPKIDVEVEIPEENIYPLPEVLTEVLSFCKGSCFYNQGLILILEPEKTPRSNYD